VKARFARKTKSEHQSILDMTSSEARAFLLKSDSYCRIDFPSYIHFGELLAAVNQVLKKMSLSSCKKDSPRKFESVNYDMLDNKDGRHAWRPLQLIHPALYVSLVTQITTKEHWRTIRSRFTEFLAIDKIKCLSIPVQSLSRQKNKAVQITHWWQGIEQKSVELALDYMYVLHADITDCYSSIYTHSIAWAIHNRDVAKARRKDNTLIGNVIDNHIQDMRHGQTNGIPQGSVLIDLIAEMVLGYADLQLSLRLKAAGNDDYLILRYRDDYRIFVNNPQRGEAVLKTLTEVMIELGLKLNTVKTTGSQSVVSSALKPDKRAWLTSRQGDRSLQKHLLVIHSHGLAFPNAGSLTVALDAFFERLSKEKKIQQPLPLISIAVDIAYQSPRTFPICTAIVSKLLSVLDSDNARRSVIMKIHNKLSQLPNTGHMEVWFQRISHPFVPNIPFKESLCKLVRGNAKTLWNSDWISSEELKKALDPSGIVDRKKLKAIKPVMRPAEVRMFSYERY
jgi:RNA-directed DNA polymerase